MNCKSNQELNRLAWRFRRTVIEMLYRAGSGHPGGSLSAAEILTVLYFDKMRLDAKCPDWPERDRFVLSKGHCAPMLYAVLAEKGYFAPEKLFTLRQLNSSLQGHPDMRKTPGVDFSTGSLGHGLSVSMGIALGARLSQKSYYVYTLLGCGELDEGQVWEAAMAASKYKVDNLIAIVDYNRFQLDGSIDEIMPLGDIVAKWRSFDWYVDEIDGHDVCSIKNALDEAKKVVKKPKIIIAHTVKGKGVSFMENTSKWHGKKLDEQDYLKAVKELEVQ